MKTCPIILVCCHGFVWVVGAACVFHYNDTVPVYTKLNFTLQTKSILLYSPVPTCVNVTGMIERLEEETRANGYIVKEQLPKDVASRRKMIQDLQKVVAVPAMGQSDLDDLNNQVSPDISVSVSAQDGL